MTMAAVLLRKSLKMFRAKLLFGDSLADSLMSETERVFRIDDDDFGASCLGLFDHIGSAAGTADAARRLGSTAHICLDRLRVASSAPMTCRTTIPALAEGS